MQHTNFSWRTGNDQLKLFGQIWQPIEPPVAVIALVHGMGEHSGRYWKFAEFFTEQGIAVIAFDQRGHGKSEGAKGHISNYNLYLEGVTELVERAKIQFKDKPVFLYGHSMGGNVVLNFALKNPTAVKGIMLSAPWLKLAFEPSPFKVKLARLMRNLYPGLTQSSQLNTDHLSRDKSVAIAYKKDKLVHDKISASAFVSFYNAGLYALQNANLLKIPTLIMHGTGDLITSHHASIDFAKTSPIVSELKIWDNLYHEIHNEPERLEVLEFAANWIKDKLKK
jgi:alpha-beta hydrolase superfamily lysophospholipase